MKEKTHALIGRWSGGDSERRSVYRSITDRRLCCCCWQAIQFLTPFSNIWQLQLVSSSPQRLRTNAPQRPRQLPNYLRLRFITSNPVKVRSTATSVPVSVRLSVCLFVCLSDRISQKRHPNFTQFSGHVTCGRGSVVLRRQCDVLCISGFVDDVTFLHNRANGQNQGTTDMSIEFSRWQQGEVYRLQLWMDFHKIWEMDTL